MLLHSCWATSASHHQPIFKIFALSFLIIFLINFPIYNSIFSNIYLFLTCYLPTTLYYKNLLFSLLFNPYFAYTKRWILSLSLSLSLYIYIYIYIYSFFWLMFNSLDWWIFMFNSTLGWYDLVIFIFFIFLILFSLFVTCYPMKLQNDLKLFYYITWLG